MNFVKVSEGLRGIEHTYPVYPFSIDMDKVRSVIYASLEKGYHSYDAAQDVVDECIPMARGEYINDDIDIYDDVMNVLDEAGYSKVDFVKIFKSLCSLEKKYPIYPCPPDMDRVELIINDSIKKGQHSYDAAQDVVDFCLPSFNDEDLCCDCCDDVMKILDEVGYPAPM